MTDYFEYYNMPIRYVSLKESRYPIDFTVFFKDLEEYSFIDEWGVGHKYGSTAHFTKFINPMKNFTTPKEVYDFPVPDVLADYRYEGMKDEAEKIKKAGYMPAYFALQIFEPAWYLRGLDNLLVDMITEDEIANACLDKMTAIVCKMAEKLAQNGVELIFYGDDVGTQKDMMMSGEMWRKWLKPTMKAAIDAAKSVNPDLLAFYHSDGVIFEIIPDLIEIGVDILNPVQPECMNPVKIKELYGDKLSFWGTIGTQTIMPFGTVEDVEKSVKEMIEKVGKGGGLVIAPTHILEPEVPWENIDIFVNSANKYGRY